VRTLAPLGGAHAPGQRGGGAPGFAVPTGAPPPRWPLGPRGIRPCFPVRTLAPLGGAHAPGQRGAGAPACGEARPPFTSRKLVVRRGGRHPIMERWSV